MLAHPWPGELQNRVQRALLLSRGAEATSADLDLSDDASHQSADADEGREALEALLRHGIVIERGRRDTDGRDRPRRRHDR